MAQNRFDQIFEGIMKGKNKRLKETERTALLHVGALHNVLHKVLHKVLHCSSDRKSDWLGICPPQSVYGLAGT